MKWLCAFVAGAIACAGSASRVHRARSVFVRTAMPSPIRNAGPISFIRSTIHFARLRIRASGYSVRFTQTPAPSRCSRAW